MYVDHQAMTFNLLPYNVVLSLPRAMNLILRLHIEFESTKQLEKNQNILHSGSTIDNITDRDKLIKWTV